MALIMQTTLIIEKKSEQLKRHDIQNEPWRDISEHQRASDKDISPIKRGSQIRTEFIRPRLLHGSIQIM